MKSTPDKRSGGATFVVACGILVTAAVAQIGLGLWGWQKQLVAREAALRNPPPVLAEPSAPAPVPTPAPAPVEETVIAKIEPPATLEKISPPVRTVENPKPIAKTLDVKITDESILELLEQGVTAREKNDMQAALEAFRAAWLKQSDHPKLIYQLARTLDLMGLESKAQPHWNTLIKLGRSAGDYFHLAELRLKQKGIVTAPSTEAEECERRIVITDVKVEKVPGVYAGQKKLLSFTLKKVAPEPISSDSIIAGIHFFDLVNGTRIARTVAAPPQAQKVSTPEDWAERGLERWEVLYDLAEMTPEELVKFGQCKYYGFALQIFQGDPQNPNDFGRLQDFVAEPEELKSFAHDLPVTVPPPTPDTADSPLFPK